VVVDDTGQHLILCAIAERDGQRRDAYRCRANILAERLAMCERNPACAAAPRQR